MCADDCAVTPLLAAAFNNHLDTCVVLIRDNCLLDVVGEFKLRSDERQLTALQVPYARYLLTYLLTVMCYKTFLLFILPSNIVDQGHYMLY